MHFQQFDLTFRMLQHTFAKVCFNVRQNVKSNYLKFVASQRLSQRLLRYFSYETSIAEKTRVSSINYGLSSMERNDSLVSKETVILRLWGSKTREFHIKRVDRG